MSSVGANNIGFASSASEREGIDTQELLEWKEAFESVIRYSGVDQAKAIMDELAAMAKSQPDKACNSCFIRLESNCPAFSLWPETSRPWPQQNPGKSWLISSN